MPVAILPSLMIPLVTSIKPQSTTTNVLLKPRKEATGPEKYVVMAISASLIMHAVASHKPYSTTENASALP